MGLFSEDVLCEVVDAEDALRDVLDEMVEAVERFCRHEEITLRQLYHQWATGSSSRSFV